MGGTVLGYCDYCGLKIDRDPLLDRSQYCDSCETHFDLLEATQGIIKAYDSGQHFMIRLYDLKKALEKFCYSL